MLQFEELHMEQLAEENDSRVGGMSDSLGNYPDAATEANRSIIRTERILVSLGRNMVRSKSRSITLSVLRPAWNTAGK
jgi:hypothetical protein